MTQSVIAHDHALDQMVQAIVEGLHPTRIILFGSRARGDAHSDSDYDIVVEFESHLEYHDSVRQVYRLLGDSASNVDIFVRKPGVLEERRNDPGRMEWDMAREGIVLYPPGTSDLTLRPVPAPGGMRVREDGPPPSVRDWLARADQDFLAIDNNLASDRPAWSYVCFHTQQAAEKLLKALLIQRYIRPSRTHDLHALVTAVRKAGYEMPDLTAECKLLKPYASDVRYPDDEPPPPPIPDETTGRQVLETGNRILAAARRHLR